MSKELQTEGHARFLTGPVSNYWTLSAKWAAQHIQCFSPAIEEGCQGCCTKSYWGSPCPCLVNNRCKFTVENRSVICVLFPFVLNPTNKLCLYARALFRSCKKNRGGDKTILECLHPQFSVLFGEEIYKN